MAFTFNLNAQNIFPVKLDNSNTSKFCLECGDIKAGYSESDLCECNWYYSFITDCFSGDKFGN